MNFDSGLTLNNYLYSKNQKAMIFNHFLCENFALTGQDLSISDFVLDSDLQDLEIKASEHFGGVGFYLNDREGFIGSFMVSVDDVEDAFDIKLKDRAVLVNMIETPDGTLLQSKSHYDFVSYKDKNGSEYFVDGGLSYLRRGGVEWVERSLYEGDPHSELREYFVWGTYGKNGDEEFKWVKLRDMDDGHIAAIVREGHGAEHVRKLMEDEIEWRKECV